MPLHSCPHCGEVHKSRAGTKKHKCKMCGGAWWDDALGFVQKAVSHPMVQQLAKAAAPHLMSAAQHYAPGLTSKVQGLISHPMAQKAFSHPMVQSGVSALRSKVGLGRRRKGARLAVGHATPGEAAYSQMRAAGGRRKPRGGFGLPGPLGMVTGMLGPLGDLISGPPPPPPPPPHASFQAIREGPMVSARPHGIGRGKSCMVQHSCPHCGGIHHARHTTKKHKCKMCGGAWWDDALGFVQKAVSHPMVQQLAKAAAPHLMSAAQHYAPGLTSKVQGLISHPMAQKAFAHPMVQSGVSALRSKVGLGRRTRAPTAHSKAVGHVMRETGMGLAQASKHVKHHGLARHFA